MPSRLTESIICMISASRLTDSIICMIGDIYQSIQRAVLLANFFFWCRIVETPMSVYNPYRPIRRIIFRDKALNKKKLGM